MKITNRRYLALAKLAAGFLEKLSVASFAVGIFQTQTAGLVVGVGALVGAVILTCVVEG